MCGCESWTIKKAERQRIDAFELGCWRRLLKLKGDQMNQFTKRNQSWILIGRTDDKTEASILWSPDVKSRLIRKDPSAQKDWEQEKEGQQRMSWLDDITNWLEFEQTPGGGEGQGSVVCYGPWVTKNRTWLSSSTTTWAAEPLMQISLMHELEYLESRICLILIGYGRNLW